MIDVLANTQEGQSHQQLDEFVVQLAAIEAALPTAWQELVHDD